MKRMWKWILSGVAAMCLNGGVGAQEKEIIAAPKAGPIATALPGTFICEHLPKQAAMLDKFTVIRSADPTD